MNVILDTPNNERLAIVFGEDAAEVAMQFVPQGFVAEKRTAIFGREDGVNQNFGEGLGHTVMMGVHGR